MNDFAIINKPPLAVFTPQWKERRMKTVSKQRGFTFLEIMIVAAAVGLLATIAMPTWVKARSTTQTQNCLNNLRQIDGAKQQWAAENKQPTSATPSFADISGYLKSCSTCPAGAATATFDDTYQMNNVGTPPQCRIQPQTHVMPVITP